MARYPPAGACYCPPVSHLRRFVLPAAFALVYLYTFPYFAELRSANEVPRVYLTTQIADRGSFNLDARWPELQRGSTFDVSTTCGDPPRAKTCNAASPACCPRPVHRFSNKAPGASFLAVPGYLAAKVLSGGSPSARTATWVARFTAATLPALIFLPFFFFLTRRFAPADEPRRAALVAYALGSMALPYAILFFSHQLAAVCAGGAFVAAVALARGESKRPDLHAVACGALAAGAVAADYQSVIAAAAVGIYLSIRSPRRLRDTILAAAGAAPVAALLLFYHWASFGSPVRTGYSFAEDQAHKQGVMGVIGPNAQAMWNALLAPDNGLVVLMPWVILAVVGGIAIARDREARARCGAEAIVCGAVLLAYLLFLGSTVPEFGRGGWSVGPRYITVALPFAAWLAAAGLAAADRSISLRIAAHASVLAGVIIYVVASTTFPHWNNTLTNPLYQVSFRILGAGLAPHSLGTLVGLRGLASLLPLYAGAAALAAWLLAGRSRQRWLTTGAALALAATLVVCYRWFPRNSGAAHWQTIQRVWEPR